MNLKISNSMRFLLLACLCMQACLSFAKESETFPEITQTEPGLFRFGEILIDQKKRKFLFPAVCNQTTGLVEYALVHENGKVHESLFRTPVNPRLIHACLLLLKESPHPGFFKSLSEPKGNLPKFRSLQISAEWEHNGTSHSQAISPMVLNQNDGRQLQGNSFIFTGSRMIEGSYLAEEDGSIVAIYHDNRATINSMDEQSDSDDVWIANAANMPPKDLPVNICFQLQSKE